MLLVYSFASCDITNITSVNVDVAPEFSTPFAKFTFTRDQLVSSIPDIDTFIISDFSLDDYLDIEAADLGNFDFNQLLVHAENKFPFGINYKVQFIGTSDSSEFIQIANLISHGLNKDVYNDTIKINSELLQQIQTAIGIKTRITFDTLSNTIIDSLSNENRATLNLGITSVINYSDTIAF